MLILYFYKKKGSVLDDFTELWNDFQEMLNKNNQEASSVLDTAKYETH